MFASRSLAGLAAAWLLIAAGALAAEAPATKDAASPSAGDEPAFTLGEIPPLTVPDCKHLAA